MGRRSGLAAVPAADLARELERRRGRAAILRRERAEAISRLAVVDAKIRAMGGDALDGIIGLPMRPGHNPMGLPTVLATAMRGKRMTPNEAAEAARRAGYRGGGRSYMKMIRNALSRHTDLFKRVERGVYTAK
ncbi:hypothetical protein PHYC_03838 [Phycisphaerales bacterium]|nr:hypothetical protein PHYC_03838 [Phycisphaerales bacterium]